MKNTISRVFIAVVLLGLVSAIFSGEVKAQTPLSTAPGYSILPIQNYDRFDDQIIQLNNLTIQSIQNGMIYASHSSDVQCLDFSTSASGFRAPCPMIAPNILYQIQISPETILLLKDRQRAVVSDFTYGDKINVYGFLDRGSNFMQALIARDLSKPVSKPSYGQYIQLNNVQVVSNPTSPYAPATFQVAQGGPCWLYSGPTGYRLSTNATCPFVPYLSTERPRYTVQVSGNTAVMNLYRQGAPLSLINEGDRVNVFGRFNPASGIMEALIVREIMNGTISIPVENASLSVTLVDKDIRCVTTPCGLVTGVQINLVGSNGARYSGVSGSDGRAFFGNLQPGNYTISSTSGYVGEQTVYIYPNERKEVTLYITRPTQSSNLRVVSPNGGEHLAKGLSYPIRWTVPAMYPGQISVGQLFDVFAVHRSYGSDTQGNVLYPIARNIFLDFGITEGVYSWNVGQSLDGLNMSAGSNYFIRICQAGTLNCDESDSGWIMTTIDYAPTSY